MRSFIKKEKGQALTEFGFILPMVLFLVLGAMIFIVSLYGKIVVIDAAREGARAEALGYSTAYLKAAEAIESGGLKEDNIQSVDVSRGPVYVTVDVAYKQPSILPLIPKLVGGNAWGEYFILKASSQFKIENP
jgi:Flp pilus assembly protein TadG